VIDEVDQINKADVTRLVLCGGKVYYDLLEKRREQNLNIASFVLNNCIHTQNNVLLKFLAQYPNIQELVWVSRRAEEPRCLVIYRSSFI
jgi:2-oxoglutarate dehydrogenase E1 component